MPPLSGMQSPNIFFGVVQQPRSWQGWEGTQSRFELLLWQSSWQWKLWIQCWCSDTCTKDGDLLEKKACEKQQCEICIRNNGPMWIRMLLCMQPTLQSLMFIAFSFFFAQCNCKSKQTISKFDNNYKKSLLRIGIPFLLRWSDFGANTMKLFIKWDISNYISLGKNLLPNACPPPVGLQR